MNARRFFSGAGLCLLWCVSAAAAAFQAGDSFVGFTAEDQHGTSSTFKAGDARFIIVDTPGETGTSEGVVKDPDWFNKNHALLVVDISDLGFLKRGVARSRLKSKPFHLLVVDDKKVSERFPKQQGKLTVLMLDPQGKVTAVRFVAPGK